MTCTEYESMCTSCQFHFRLLRERKVSAEDMEYTAGTYPVVFTCTQDFSLPKRAGTLMKVEYLERETTVTSIKDALNKYFHRDVNVYDHFEECEFRVDDKTTVTYKILVDFPGVIEQPDSWAAWIAQFMGEITFSQVVPRLDGKRCVFPRMRIQPGKKRWDGVRPEDESHLCWTRLVFFLETQDLVPFI